MPRAMRRSLQLILATTLVAAAFSAAPAHAQLGNIFGNQPPRPPSNVGPQGQDPDAEEVPGIPPGRILPGPIRPPPPGTGMAPPGSVQAPALPAAGTTAVAEGAPNSEGSTTGAAPVPLPGLPPGQ